MLKIKTLIGICSISFLSSCVIAPPEPPTPTPEPVGTEIPVKDLSWIANKIFMNETSGDYDKLVYWSPAEEFMSLGIAHFIWYPDGQTGPYTETFPALLHYFKQTSTPLPEWLQNRGNQGAPWAYRDLYIAQKNSYEAKSLQDLLSSTMNLQANFMAQRLRQTLPRMLQQVPQSEKAIIQARYKSIEQSPKGLYPLLDYVNFKGEGIAYSERYHGQGWGLLQVLREMPDVPPGHAALTAFADAAERILTRRIDNAPPIRKEHRWLAGWIRRLDTYRPEKLWQ